MSPLSKFIATGPDLNIKFLGCTKDGRHKYEFIDKHTGERRIKIMSKETYVAMNRIIQEYAGTIEKLSDK